MESGRKRASARSWLWQGAKVAFAAALIVILVRSGTISLDKLKVFFTHPGIICACLVTLATAYVTAFLRWRLLARAQGIPLTRMDVVKLGMVGQFFSTVIPSSVGGDVVKAVFVARRFPGRRIATVSTVFLDRVVGLCSLILIGATAFVLGADQIAASTHGLAPMVLTFGWVLVASSVAILVGLLLFPAFAPRADRLVPDRFRKIRFIRSFLEMCLAYAGKSRILWVTMAISLFSQAMQQVTLFLATYAIYGLPPWGAIGLPSFILGSALGLCATALPITPLGLGVGQAAFATLFAAMGAESGVFGSTIITALQAVTLFLNLTGVFFFLTYRHEVGDIPVSELAESGTS